MPGSPRTPGLRFPGKLVLYQQTAKKRIFSRKTTAGTRVPGGERSRCPCPLCWRDWSRQGGWCGPAGCPPARLKQRAHLPRTLHPAAPCAEPPRRPPGGGTSRQRPEASGASRAGTLGSGEPRGWWPWARQCWSRSKDTPWGSRDQPRAASSPTAKGNAGAWGHRASRAIVVSLARAPAAPGPPSPMSC